MNINIIKVALVAITGLTATFAMFECKENGYQPDRQQRIFLFCIGTVASFCVVWLAIPEPFWSLFWLKLLGGIAGGYSWAFVVPERLRS